MIPLDAVSDALNKILDKAQQYAPTVWDAALHQVAINARISFMWGVGWSVLGVLAALIGWGIIPGLHLADRRNYKRALQLAEGQYALDSARAQETTGRNDLMRNDDGYQYRISKFDYQSRLGSSNNPKEDTGFVASFAAAAFFAVLLCGALALYSFWNAWQMSQNPTWWAIQLIKG